jgi:penicillin-binding protein 2
VGDNVQFSIGQGLLSATPVQVARAYSVLASGGNVLRPHVVRYLLAPGTPDSKPGYADIENGRIIRDLRTSQVISAVDMSGDRREPILRGLKRVITGPGVTSDYYHKTTGEKLFANYPYEILPIAGKTGTAQGFNNLPWNDSSAFGSFSLALNRPFTVVAYLEKSGYGSQAAAPVAKCLWLAIAGQWRLPEVFPAEPLDVASTAVAKSQSMPNPQCLSTPYTGLRE